ncbi:MAG: hypothetical protein JSS14_02350 [Proteobacteria bacterium]|nr:hypothetical protein [Pseudomonadota bacterium]
MTIETKITIQLGATIRVSDLHGMTKEYIFQGGDGSRLIFRDGHGNTHYDVLSIPYTKVEITPPR